MGPAKYLVELIKYFPNSKVISSSLNHNLFRKNGYDISKDITIVDKAKLVVVGTSLGNKQKSLDKKIILRSKKYNIPSIAIIEHWSWYKERFMSEDSFVFPNYIIVNDNIALKQAKEQGLPKKT